MRSRPCGESWYEHLGCWSTVANRGMRPDRVVVTSPAFDDDLRLAQRIEDLAVEQLVAQPGIKTLDEAVVTSLTPIERIASPTPLPCDVSTSTCRNLATISSGL